MSEKNYPYIANLKQLPARPGTIYPEALAAPVAGRAKTKLAEAVGLTQFGVNLTVLPPGAWSSHRHWHQHEDEFVMILEGEATLVTDEGETRLAAGDVVGFPAGYADGHHLRNDSAGMVSFIEVGTRAGEELVSYPDVDLAATGTAGRFRFWHKNGDPWE